jgi:hypothetical protein
MLVHLQVPTDTSEDGLHVQSDRDILETSL